MRAGLVSSMPDLELALRERLPGNVALRFGTSLRHVGQRSDGVGVTLTDKSILAAGLPVCADGIQSAVETVNPKLRSSLDAAALAKMAERGQIRGGVVDGPLAFDNAVSPAAARVKGITSPVAGQADIVVVPDLESGNMLAKQLDYLADSRSTGIVLGARVPIVLTSRAAQAPERMASCALAVLMKRLPERAKPGQDEDPQTACPARAGLPPAIKHRGDPFRR